MKDKNQIEKKILALLKEHPEGLPILEIAKHIGVHRHTVTKYIYYLMGTGAIHQREVAAAKLCYLSSKIADSAKEKEVLEKIEKGLEK